MIDLHVHTTESDGNHTMEDILKQCICENIKLLAFTDHWKTKRYSEDFYVDDVRSYLQRAKIVKEKAKRLGINILIGLEVDFTEIYGFPISDQDIQNFNELDFVLFEYVNTKEEHWGILNGKSVGELFEITNKITVPVGVAHNDFYNNFHSNYEDIIVEMSKRGIFLELCEGEELGRQKVDTLSLKKLLTLKKNLSNLEIYKGNAKLVKKKHVKNDKFYFEHFPEHLWHLIKKYHLLISIGTDNHSGIGLGNHPLIDTYLERYQLHNQLIFNSGVLYETNMSR